MNEELIERIRLLVPINNLPAPHQEQVISTAEVIDLGKNEFIFHQGDRDNFSYYLLEGNIEMYAGDQLIKKVTGGEGASFQALSQLQPRQMSAETTSKAKVLRIDRILLDQLLTAKDEPAAKSSEIEVNELDETSSSDWLTHMLQSELFGKVPPSNIQKLLDILETVEFKAGDDVIKQGDVGDYYYAIQSGRCEVLRRATSNKEIRLAELGPGARFGEESLVSNAKRNATVRMLTDGELARLTKADFIELIKKPVLDSCALSDAREYVEQGAKWLDVRFPEEHRANGIIGSLNIPLSFLRNKTGELDQNIPYVVYCDTGGRSSAGAFLLTQSGFNAVYVENGAIDEVPADIAAKIGDNIPAAEQERLIDEEGTTVSEDLIEADARAQSLNADLERANMQIERAQKLMAEAEAAKNEADRLVEEKLRQEREKLARDAAAIEEERREVKTQAENTLRMAREQLLKEAEEIEKTKREAAKSLEDQLQAERAKLQQETELVQTKLEEAKKLKEQLAERQKLAAEEAEKRFQEQQYRTLEVQRKAEQRLQEKESDLEALYLKQADELEQLQLVREQSEQELVKARQEIEIQATLSKERLEAAKNLEMELSEKHAHQLKALVAREEEMRAELQAEINRERELLENEFAKTTEELEKARLEQEAAERARLAAAEEAQNMIAEYKAAEEQRLKAHEEKLLLQRQQIERGAERLKEDLARAAVTRKEAERLKAEAEKKLAAAVEQQASRQKKDAKAEREIAAIKQQARDAADRLRDAMAVENLAESQQRENEEKLERSYSTNSEMNILLQNELDEWVSEQAKLQESTAQQNTLAKQRDLVERIKKRAKESKRRMVRHDKALIDEIAEQLNP